MRSLRALPLRAASRAGALLAVAAFAGGLAKADTGYSELFTVDLRTSLANTVFLERIDDVRTPLELETRPGDDLFLYFTLRRDGGEPVSAGSFEYALRLSGATAADSGAFAWSVEQAGVVKLTLKRDSLRFATNPARVVLPQGSGFARVDGSPVAIGNDPPDVTLRVVSSPYRDRYVVYADGSSGTSGHLGSGAGQGATKASVEAARFSVKGSAGGGFSLEVGTSGSLSLERRTNLGVAGLLEVPSTELRTIETFEVTGPSIATGGERGAELGQRIEFSANDLRSDEARVSGTAFLLESASLTGNLVPSPLLGLVQRAAVETALRMSGAPALLQGARREAWAGAALGGSLPAQALSVETPVASSGEATTSVLGLSLASLDGIVASRSALLYSPSDGQTSGAGLENRWTLALAGSSPPATWDGQLRRIFGAAWADVYAFSTSVLARLGTDGSLRQAGVDLSVQPETEGDLALFRARDHEGFDVRMRVGASAVLDALRGESPAQLAALAGDATAVLDLTTALADSTARYIVDRAEALAPAGTVAFTADADRRSGRVQTGEFDLGLEFALPLESNSSIAFGGSWEQARLVESAVSTCRADGKSWDVRSNPSAGSWQLAPSIEQLLSGTVLAGVAPLVEGALRGLLGSVSTILAPGSSARGRSEPLATIRLDVDDPATGRQGGRAEFPSSYDGFTATLQTGDPSRPEATTTGSGAATVRRTLTTRRVFTGPVPSSRRSALEAAAASSTELTLIGNFVSLELKPEGGVALDPLPAPVTLAVDLYDDQVTRMGADPARLAEAKLFRYDGGTGTWELVGGSLSADGSLVSAAVTRPGTYAPGLLTSIPPGDSDGDGLLDAEEDRNGNGIVDAGESDPWARDSDGDGVDDARERLAGTDPMVAASVPNRAPTLGFVSSRRLGVGEVLSLSLRATDPDGDPLVFSAQGLPPDASLDASTGAFRFAPQKAGTWRVAFTATDAPRSGSPLSDTKTMVLQAQQIAADGELTDLTRAVPIVLDARGANSSHYTTALTLTNRGNTPVSLTLRYQASIGDPAGSGAAADTLAPGEQRTIPDVLPYLRSLGLPIPQPSVSGSQGGVLLVRFEGAESEESVAATARTTTATASPQPAGAAGLAYLGSPPEFASEGTLIVYGLRDTSSDRSNLAVWNPSPEAVTVRVTAFSGDGTGFSRIVRDNLTVPGFGWEQLNDVLSGTGITGGWVTVLRTSSSGRFGTYGVVNDNATNDGSFVPPTPASISGNRLTVPVLVETPAFQSELVLANRGSSTATLSLSYVEGLTPSIGSGGKASVVLRPGEQKIIPGAIDYLRQSGMTIGAAGTGEYAGALRVNVSGATLADVFAGARTAAPSPAGGQFGLFTPGVYESDTASEEAFVYGLRADAANRSSLAVVHAGGDGDAEVTLEVQVFDGDRGGVPAGAPLEVTLAPGGWKQVTGILQSLGIRNGWAHVRRVAGTAAWLAYGVVNDGANPGERTGDGSYVPMTMAERNELTVTLPGGVPLVLVKVRAGTFQMGAPATEKGASALEQPRHQVTLTEDYYLGKYEVTQAQWTAVMATNPSVFLSCGGNCPVEQVLAEEILGPNGFLAKLNVLLGTTKFRLPTEAEWERAARGGTQTRFSFGDALDGDDVCGANAAADPYVWWCGSSGPSTRPVGTKLPNSFGLFDMHGNVWEMVADFAGMYPSAAQTDPTGPSTGSARMIRGGSWLNVLSYSRSASRFADALEFHYGLVGFRVARSR